MEEFEDGAVLIRKTGMSKKAREGEKKTDEAKTEGISHCCNDCVLIAC